jgi:hypothetical protein
MRNFVSMVDDTLASKSSDSEKILWLSVAIRRVDDRAARFQDWAVQGRVHQPCPEKPGVTADDFLILIQLLEERRSAIEGAIRAKIAEHENAPLETFQAIGDVASGICRRLNGYNRERFGDLDADNRLTASDYGVGRSGRA